MIEFNKKIQAYRKSDGSVPITQWMESLDNSVRHRVKERLRRITLGNFGDCKNISTRLFELRLDFGPGYRIYLSEIDSVIILLLCGGNKKSQNKDIKMAKEYLKDYLGEDI